MSTDEYLHAILNSQCLEEGSKEIRELQKHRADVETLLRKKFGWRFKIRYGGSKAKLTMNLESYDLDLHVYFPRDDMSAGATLQEIYDNVALVLDTPYLVERKRSALRLRCRDLFSRGTDLRIDVVPGRFIEGDEGDVWLHQNEGNKERRQTNLEIQISHIRDSGVVDAIRLIKLWKVRNGLIAKTFVLELLVVKLLSEHKEDALADQLTLVLTAFRDRMNDLAVQDPANLNGNDLSDLLDEARYGLSTASGRTLQLVEESGWEAVFGSADQETDEDKRRRLLNIAAGVSIVNRTKPWGCSM